MPKRKPSVRSPRKKRSKVASESSTPLEDVRHHADALLRAALECCRQHDRFARLLVRRVETSVEIEERAVEELCSACDQTLAKVVAAYEKAAAHVHPVHDATWWHRANSLWHASREYDRRHQGCDELTRRPASHSPHALGALQLQFELEASALLALRHACDAYACACPDAA